MEYSPVNNFSQVQYYKCFNQFNSWIDYFTINSLSDNMTIIYWDIL